MTDTAVTDAKELLAEITRLRALTTPQPIETAPKDGAHILVFWWDDDQQLWDESWWSTDRETWANCYDPTHWLPRPEAPK